MPISGLRNKERGGEVKKKSYKAHSLDDNAQTPSFTYSFLNWTNIYWATYVLRTMLGTQVATLSETDLVLLIIL